MSDNKYSSSTSTSTDKRPGKTNGYSSNKLWQKRRQRQFEADDRQAKYDALSLDEKIKSCVPGGSNRQRAKLMALKATQPVVKVTSTEKKPVVKKKVTKK
jgi:hypothetical protein